jgi:hypothetical protein
MAPGHVCHAADANEGFNGYVKDPRDEAPDDRGAPVLNGGSPWPTLNAHSRPPYNFRRQPARIQPGGTLNGALAPRFVVRAATRSSRPPEWARGDLNPHILSDTGT